MNKWRIRKQPDGKPTLYGPTGRPLQTDGKTSAIIIWLRTNKTKLQAVIGLGLAIIGLMWGFYSYYRPKGEPDLYISLSRGNPESQATPWQFEQPSSIPHHGDEVIAINVFPPRGFYELTGITKEGAEKSRFKGYVAGVLTIWNLGNGTASGVWCKLFASDDVSTWLISNEDWNMTQNEEQHQTIYYWTGDGSSIKPNSPHLLPGIFAVDLPLEERTLEFPYVVGGKNIKLRNGVLRVKIIPKGITFGYTETIKGIESVTRGEMKQAIIHFGRAIQDEPGNAAYLFNLGTASLLVKDPKNAYKALLKASEALPEISEIWSHLAISCAQLHRREEALRALDKALDLNPKNSVALQNRQVLLRHKQTKGIQVRVEW